MYNNFIVIKGQPNTGKTTLANALKNTFPHSIVIETDWIEIQLIKKEKIIIPEKYKKIIGNCLGQILLELDEKNRKILFDEVKKEIDYAFLTYDTVITEGYLWTFNFYQTMFNYYSNICFINKYPGYSTTISLNNELIVGIVYPDIESVVKKIIETIKIDAIKRILPIFGNYQQFDFLTFQTSSQTLQKLKFINIPDDLTGKRILDIGCNNGFFTIECDKRGAQESIGIDNAKLGILVANIIKNSIYLCKNVTFLVKDINEDMSDFNNFDYIFILSTFHYFKNQYELLKKILLMLKPDGILKLEIGIYQSDKNNIYQINNKFYPSEKKISEWLCDYYFTITSSVNQAGDSIPRFVVTVKNNK